MTPLIIGQNGQIVRYHVVEKEREEESEIVQASLIFMIRKLEESKIVMRIRGYRQVKIFIF